MIFNVTIIDLFAYHFSNVNIALKNKRKISTFSNSIRQMSQIHTQSGRWEWNVIELVSVLKIEMKIQFNDRIKKTQLSTLSYDAQLPTKS